MNQTSDKSDPNSDVQVLMTLYQILRNNQELYINQQWKIIYYTTLLYAAIFGAFVFLKDFKCLMYIIALVILFVSLLITFFCENSLSVARKYCDKIQNHELAKIIKEIIPEQDHSKSTWIFRILISINIFGCFFLIFIIYQYNPA
jgi:magnesium-transporting ATPase (P-type)